MLFRFIESQWKYPVKHDWVIQVKEDLSDFDMDLTLDDIKSKSKNVFKKMVKTKMKEFSLNYLNKLKEKHSKMDNLVYPKLKTQNYLKDGEINVQSSKKVEDQSCPIQNELQQQL